MDTSQAGAERSVKREGGGAEIFSRRTSYYNKVHRDKAFVFRVI